MTGAVKLFVASSWTAYAGGGPADAVRGALEAEFRDAADVVPWTRAFALTKTYIESLEAALETTDFAVIVATADDLLTKDNESKLVPRDNVMFELGLFMGALGRERCFIVEQDDKDLHLPTDLLGVEAARFTVPADGALAPALERAISRIAAQVRPLGARVKVAAQTRAARRVAQEFAELIAGTWWERVFGGAADASALSFMTIELDAETDGLRISGRAFDADGAPAASWSSELARIDEHNRRIVYHWSGRGLHADTANRQFNGFGQMEFDRPAQAGGGIARGRGMFWNIDEATPERTIMKPIELRRIIEPSVMATLNEGSRQDVRALVTGVIAQW